MNKRKGNREIKIKEGLFEMPAFRMWEGEANPTILQSRVKAKELIEKGNRYCKAQ